jgi:hypothetical protein
MPSDPLLTPGSHERSNPEIDPLLTEIRTFLEKHETDLARTGKEARRLAAALRTSASSRAQEKLEHLLEDISDDLDTVVTRIWGFGWWALPKKREGIRVAGFRIFSPWSGVVVAGIAFLALLLAGVTFIAAFGDWPQTTIGRRIQHIALFFMFVIAYRATRSLLHRALFLSD